MNNTKAKQESERVTVYRHDMKPCELAVHITTNPGAYGASHVELAKAYEAQREHIADLEDDVERLRPISPFVPEVLFRDEDNDTDIETSIHGGLDIVQRDHNGSAIETNLTKTESHQLATALAKWAGLDGVEWREIKYPPEDGAFVLIGGSKDTSLGYVTDADNWQYSCRRASITHWAPLPKPPSED